MNKQKLALFILLIVLVLSVVWSFISIPRQKTISDLKHAPGQIKQPEKTMAGLVVKPAENSAKLSAKPLVIADTRTLQLGLLEREQSGFKGYHRNLFKPIFTDEIRLMKQRSVAFKPPPMPPVAAAVAPKPPPARIETQAEIQQKTLAQFIFLGFLKKDNRKTIFLSKDKQIILVRKGEIFAKLYEASSITDNALTIRVIATGEEIVIPLNENRPLTVVSK